MKRHLIYFFAGILLVSMFFCWVSSASAQVSVSNVQAAIKAAGATWVASENPVTKLTPEEQKRLLGVKNAPKATTHPPTKMTAAYGLPASLDWRNNGGNYVTGIRDQAACGSCWAHAGIAALESATLINNKTPNTELNLSEQVLISCCSSICSPQGDCNGGYPEKAADFLRDQGAPTESCYPYVMNGVCTNACPNWQASAYKIKSWDYVVNYDQNEAASVDAIRAGLQEGPLATTYAVYTDFFYYTSGVYQRIYGALAGYHAVLVVGYDDPGQYFIVKNSWGTDWGEQGYFRIAYSEVTGASQFGYETIAYHVGDDPNPTCDYALGDYFPGAGGTGTIQMTIDEFAWAAGTDDYWISTSQPYSMGSGPLNFTVAPNTTSSPRTGAVTFYNGQTQKIYPVVQGAGSGQCTYSISPTSTSFDASGGRGQVMVTTGSGCPWAAEGPGIPFGCYITSGSQGVIYTINPNTYATPQTMIIKIADKDFTITQAGCPISISPVSQNVPADGGTGTVNVTAASNCQWQATSNASWITMTGGGNYSVSANTGTSSRTGTITIGDKTFTVTQPGGSACTFSVNPASQSYGASSGDPNKYVMGSFALTASSPGCFWEATSHATWIRTDYYSRTGSGSRTSSYYVADNFAPPSRTGTITVGGQTFTVTQGAQSCIPTFAPKSQVFTSAGGTGTVSVTAPSGCPWTVRLQEGSADPVSPIPLDFITITSAPFGTGNGTITYSVAPNTRPYNRGAYIYVGESQFAVNQEGGSACQYTLVSAAWVPWMSAGSAGGPSSVQLFTTSPSCAWQATSNAPWITVTSPSGKGDTNVTFSVAANNTGLARTGTLTIGGQALTLAQGAANNCTFTLSPTQQLFNAPGGTATVSVIPSSSSCAWTAVAVDPWIAITSGQSGKGNGTVSYTVSENTVYGMRWGTITIGGWMLLVGQYWPGCSNFALSPASQSFGAAGGTGAVTITGSSGCNWTTLASVDWITITSGVGGVGKGMATYAVAPNTSSTSRTGQINFGNGGLFTVNQDPGGGCSYSIGSTSQPFSAAGGTGSVGVTAGSGCAWTASSNVSWITVSSGGNGSGNGSVGYSVTANSSTTSRNGTLTIAGQTFTVSQAAQACTYAISPTSNSLSAGAGTGIVNVASASGCSWTATSNATGWLSVTSGSSGSGSGSVGYSVTANTTTTSRSGTLTVGGQTFTVTQAGMSCTYAINPTSQNINAAGGSGSVSVSATSGCAWTATSNATNFLTVTSGSSGSGNGTVNYSVTANTTTAQRTGTITIAGQAFTVSQSGNTCTYIISATSKSFTSASGTGSVSVTTSSGCSWSATSAAPSWLTITSGASGTGSGTVNYTVTANTTTAQRNGTLTIGGQTFTVTQSGMACTYAISPTSQTFGSTGGSGSVTVSAASGCTWTASSGASWLAISSGGSGSGNGTVNYSVTANTSTAARSGTLIIAGQTFTVTQQGVATCGVSLSAGGFNFGYMSRQGNFQVSAATTCSWSAQAGVPWIHFSSGPTGKGTATVIFTVDTNTGAARTGTISVNGSNMTVNQQAHP